MYVPIRNKQKSDYIELVVFADDAAKIQRIYDNLGLDYVKAEAGEATVEKAVEQEKQAPAALPTRQKGNCPNRAGRCGIRGGRL